MIENCAKSYSFAAHFEQHFNTTASRTYLRKYMNFKVVNQLNPIGAMKTFTKPKCNLCMQESLTILKIYVKTRHGYEQELGDSWGLSAQNDFPSIFPKH